LTGILVTGASSLPGFRIVCEALKKGYDVIALYWKNPIPISNNNITKIRMDIRDLTSLKNLLHQNKPDIVIHAAALGDVDLCEKDKKLAWETNVQSTISLASLTAKLQAFLVYLSTDYVFDGEKGNYSEEEPPNPVDYYGFTKLMGEIACMSAGTEYAIVRASSIYGFGPGRKNFAKFLVEKLSKNETVKALVDQYTSPTQATLLGETVIEIVEKKLTGIFHVVGEKMSRYEFALKVAETLNLDKSLISPAKFEEMSWFAKRPRNSSLNFEKTKEKLKIDFYSTEKAFQTLKNEYISLVGGKQNL